ncbi:unnamed protein product [Rhizoctonia solani]|uniref:Pre-rRNA-processing protein RIX1 n=1 Tax=Rhizoctonia solani TaxID=456999 RepID=A0A8H3GKT2_9AGAM|nr:unnamed protein product [Rhizoctonia solani]
MSSTKHPLELLLQNHLGTDESALKYLPNALSTLQQSDIFGEARVLGKWNARINSFLHSREAASRWVGLYLARYTALGSRQILVDNAQGWVGVVLPMLSKPEPFPNHYAAIRLLSHVFTAVTDMPEFQRQVVIPSVQKCSQALLALAKDSETEFELKLLAIDTLTQLTTYHPTHHKALHQQLLSFTLEHLQGSFPLQSNASLLIESQPPSLVTSTIRLHASLALTGGKVGAGMIWRQSLDSTMGTIWTVLETLRNTYLDVPRPSTTIVPFSFPELPADPALAGPIALDRFRGMIRLLVHLLETPTSRPVSIPLGPLAHLALTLLRFNADSPSQSTGVVYEAIQRVNEVAIVPELCVAGCMLAQQLAQTCGKLFTPYVSQVFMAITLQLEQNITTERRARILTTIPPILANTHNLAPSASYNRLSAQVLKVLTNTHNLAPSASYNRLSAQVLKVLSPLLPSSRTYSQIQTPQESVKGKKRTRYEGDELFSSHSSSSSLNSLQSVVDDELHVAALFALAALLPTLPLATQTTIQRTLLALLIHLPKKGNGGRLVQEISRVYACTLGESSSGTLGVGVQALKAIEESYDRRSAPGTDHQRIVHRFLHPRIPPNSRSGPTIDDIPLFWKDKEDEEAKEFRQAAGITTVKEITSSGPPLEMPKDSNDADQVMRDQDVETTKLSQNGVLNGVHRAFSTTTSPQPSPQPTDVETTKLSQNGVLNGVHRAFSTTTSSPQPSLQPTVSPVVPMPPIGSSAPSTVAPPPVSANTTLPSSEVPQPSAAIPASSLFRSSGALNVTTQATTSSAPTAGPSSISLSTPDDDEDDEPMPQIDLGVDTDEDV